MHRPDYDERCIVNLMGSILAAEGAEPPYPPLSMLDGKTLSDSTNLLLVCVDGLGYDFLDIHGKGSVLKDHVRGELCSVFPSTTASAVTSFTSGVSTQEHAITGWFVHLKEVGAASVILPFAPRFDRTPYGKHQIAPGDIYDFPRIFDHVRRKAFFVINRRVMHSDYTGYVAGDAERFGYRTLRGFIRQIIRIIERPEESKFIYAYWPGLDHCGHEKGINSPEAVSHFRALDESFRYLLKRLVGSDTTVIIVADHGLIDTKPGRVLEMRDHPYLRETLVLPLCGEPRVPYCYVRPARVDDFLSYVRDRLPFACEVFSADELIEKRYFGSRYEHPRFRDRVGDYVLLMRENYVLRDQVLGEEFPSFTGYHGGLSREELFVPLIVKERI